MILTQDFKDFLNLLDKYAVPYLIVGGIAVSIHSYPRYTKDLDLWLEVNKKNAEAMMLVLEEFGFGSLGLSPQDFLEVGIVIQLGHEPNRIDLLTDLPGVNFAEAYPKRVNFEIDGLSLTIIDKESLIQNKRTVGRTRDLSDVEQLEAG